MDSPIWIPKSEPWRFVLWIQFVSLFLKDLFCGFVYKNLKLLDSFRKDLYMNPAFLIIHHFLWNTIQDFWICLFYWTRLVDKQGYNLFKSERSKQTNAHLTNNGIMLSFGFVIRLNQIAQVSNNLQLSTFKFLGSGSLITVINYQHPETPKGLVELTFTVLK